MKSLTRIIALSLALVGVITLTAVGVSESALAQSAADKMREGVQSVGGGDNSIKLEDGIKTVVNVILFLLGSIAVIMIIIGGIRYATSNGDSSATKSAKDTILYAVIGLIVAILAYAIVNFVIGAFANGGGGSTR